MNRIEKTKKNTCIILLLAMMVLMFVSCSASNEQFGAISVTVGENNSRTIRPDAENTTIVKHVVKGYLNNDISFSHEFTGANCLVDNLIAGSWKVYVEGLNTYGKVVAESETKTIDVIQNKNTSASFVLDYKSDGKGSMDLTIEIPSAESTIAKVVGVVTHVTPGLSDIEFTVLRRDASLSDNKLCFNKKANLPVGSYRVSFKMYDSGNNQVGQTLNEVIYIYQYQVSSFTWYWDKDYVPPVAPPSFDLVEGTYLEGQSISISSADPDATIFYSTDGTVPDKNSIQYTGPITLDRTMEIKAIAVKAGLNDSQVASSLFTAKVKTPDIVLPAGVYGRAQETSINCETDGATIYYTMDGSTPNEESFLYSSKVQLTENTFLKVVASKDGLEDSDIVSKSFLFMCFSPVFSLEENVTYDNAQSTTISIPNFNPGLEIYYTVDGSDPLDKSNKYLSAIPVDGNVTLKARTIKEGWLPSNEVTMSYRFKCANPVLSSESGTYDNAFDLKVVSATKGSTVYYTDDGSNPAENGKVFNSMTIASDKSLKFCVKKDGYETSDVISAEYRIAPQNSDIQILNPKGLDFKISKPSGWFSGMYLLSDVEATLSLSTQSQIDSYCWYYDGREIDIESTTISVGGPDAHKDITLEPGGHSIGAKIVIDDRSYSETIYYICIDEYNGEPGCVSWGDITMYGIGPAGGYVIYDVDADNDQPIYMQDGLESEKTGWRYIEVAPYDLKIYGGLPSIENVVGTSSKFCFGYNRTTADGDNVYSDGTSNYDATERGKKGQSINNTKLIVRGIGESAYINETGSDTTNNYAASVVDKLVSHNVYGLKFDDWGLPTAVEMNMIQRDSHSGRIPKLPNADYWTSVEDWQDAGQAFCSDYALGEIITGGSLYPKQMKFAVRPVRYF